MASQVGHPQLQGEKARRTRAGLVDAVAAEIAATGSFTAERVALRAGTSVATFYSYLPSKDAALAAAFDRVLERLLGWLDGALSLERLLEVGLPGLARELVRGGVAFFAAEARVFRLALSRMPGSPALRVVYREHEAAALARYARFVELGARAGKIRAGDPRHLARALLVLTQGLNNPLALGRDADDPLLALLADALVRLLEPAAQGETSGAGRSE